MTADRLWALVPAFDAGAVVVEILLLGVILGLRRTARVLAWLVQVAALALVIGGVIALGVALVEFPYLLRHVELAVPR